MFGERGGVDTGCGGGEGDGASVDATPEEVTGASVVSFPGGANAGVSSLTIVIELTTILEIIVRLLCKGFESLDLCSSKQEEHKPNKVSKTKEAAKLKATQRGAQLIQASLPSLLISV